MRAFIGIDGGGTKTDLALVDEHGVLLARVHGETCNQAVVGFEAAVAVLSALIDRAMAEASLDLPASAGWIGMAGADRPDDRSRFARKLRSRCGNLRITNDAELVLSGTPQGTGIALIAGTGSIAFARNERGDSGRSGGWGHVIGDEGSAYMVAVDGLRAVAAETDGRGPATRLTADLLTWWRAERAELLIPRIYDPTVKKADIAASAPVVVAAAEAGDQVATTILQRAGDDLAVLTASLLDRVPFETRPVVAGTGGLLLHTTLVRDRVSELLDPARVRPEIELVDEVAVSVARAASRFDWREQR
jgi:glucosamine kinase